MNLLLDTHAFLWFIGGDPRLTSTAKEGIENPDNIKLVSIASFWEMAVKISLGRLSLDEPFAQMIPRQMEKNGFDLLTVQVKHLEKLIPLPFHHRDPFDRLLAAQAIGDDLALVSGDAAFDAYPVRRIW